MGREVMRWWRVAAGRSISWRVGVVLAAVLLLVAIWSPPLSLSSEISSLSASRPVYRPKLPFELKGGDFENCLLPLVFHQGGDMMALAGSQPRSAVLYPIRSDPILRRRCIRGNGVSRRNLIRASRPVQ